MAPAPHRREQRCDERRDGEQYQQAGEECGESSDAHEVLDVLCGDVLEDERAEVVLETCERDAAVCARRVSDGKYRHDRVGFKPA